MYLNPQYSIRNEKTCSYIVKRNTIIDKEVGVESPTVVQIPPFIGYILSAIDQGPDSIRRISNILGIRENVVKNFVSQITENKSPILLKYGTYEIHFPKRLLLKGKDREIEENKQLNFPFRLNGFYPSRPKTPLSINFMVTTKCTTDCIYCYADRSRTDDLSAKEVIDIIDEIHQLGVVNLTLTGGDVLAHPKWKFFLQRCSLYNFNLFLSTKTPISDDDVCFLSSIGVKNIQFSLDSIVVDILKRMIRVGERYIEDVRRFFSSCEKNNITVSIRTVLTKYNSSPTDFISLNNFLCSFSNIDKWVITPAFYSEFKSDKNDFEIANDAMKDIYMVSRSLKSHYPILFNKINSTGYALRQFDSKEVFLAKNQTCHANSYSMAILSNGKCTICEMLYDNKHFLIGDLRISSLSEVWNSQKALSLYSRDLLECNKKSPCRTCDLFSLCKNQIDKKICYVDIVKSYGRESGDMPDPRCPKAPTTNIIL